MRLRLTVVIAAIGLCATAVPARAHHSFTAEFAEEQSVTLKGVISKVEWVNPHVYLYIDVADATGKVSAWSIETFPPSTLRRAGLTREKLGYGQNVTLLGYPARNGSQLALLRKITFADGREILISLGDIKKVR